MHSGPFGCLTKLGAKRAEQVQKFVPRSRVGIFQIERTRSTPLDPKLTFWCVLFHLDAFGTVWLPYETWYKTGRTSAKVRATKSRRNFLHERTQSTPLDTKLTFWCVSYYLGAFGTVRLPYETWCKMGGTSAKVHDTKSLRNFSHRTHPIHPLDPKLKILVRFVLFGCIWKSLVALRNSVQNGRTSAKVRATKSHRNFSQRTHPIHPIGP